VKEKLTVRQAWKLEREKKFPARVKVGERAVRWRESDVRAWITTRKA